MKDQLKWVLNHMPKSDDQHLDVMSLPNVAKARSFHGSFPQYSITPLAQLDGMAQYLGLAGVYVKDESYRFGLNAFKVLGGSFAMARYIAKNLVAAGLASRCQVTLAYAIGRAEPVMVQADTFGTGLLQDDHRLAETAKLVFGLTPGQIIAQLDLLTPRYAQTAVYGHFGKPDLPWEKTDQAKRLREAVL